MTGLLELREKIKLIYSKNEVFIIPIAKFLLAFIVFNTINGQLGYMTKLDNIAIVLIVSLMCSFLPTGCILLLSVVFTMLHMYALSLEVAVVGLCVYLVMFLLFFRFSPKDSLVVVLTPLLCIFKVPYIIPVVMGLIGTPVAAVSVGCGVIVYYLLNVVAGSASTIGTMGEEEATAKIRMIVDGILDNKAMLVMVVAFAITVIVVYLIRRMSVDYSWTIAMVAGAIIDLVILLVGDLLYDTNISVINAILGSIAAVAAAKVIEFFRFCVDYSRTEKVQFEDDEYYYYVKAVPKMTVAVQTKTVKRINTQRKPAAAGGRNTAGTGGRSSTRSVVTEHTSVARGEGAYQRQRGQSSYGRKGEHANGGRSLTINGNMTEDNIEDFDDL